MFFKNYAIKVKISGFAIMYQSCVQPISQTLGYSDTSWLCRKADPRLKSVLLLVSVRTSQVRHTEKGDQNRDMIKPYSVQVPSTPSSIPIILGLLIWIRHASD